MQFSIAIDISANCRAHRFTDWRCTPTRRAKIRDGDRIVVDVSRRLPPTGETFVLWDGIGLVVKHVEAIHGDAVDQDEPPRLRLISANADYAPYSCVAQDVHILSRVLWVIRRA